MKNEKLLTFAAAFGWFGAYILLSLLSAGLPDAVDCAVTIIALWGLIFLCSEKNEGKNSFSEKLSYGGIRKSEPITILLALLAGAGLNLTFSGLLPLLPLSKNLVESYIGASAHYKEPTTALMLKTVLLVPILEETVFRGLIGDRIVRSVPKWIALPFASLVFAVMHVNILWMSYAFISGLILTGIYYRCNSILPCIVFHLTFNASNYLWEMILKFPDEKTGYLISFSIGAAVTLPALILLFFRKQDGYKDNFKI